METVSELLTKKTAIQNSIDFFSTCDPFIEEIDAIYFKRQLRFLENKMKLVDKQIKELCNHEYVEDWIDLDPDRSVKIKYCSICQTSK
jgi:hypothetical protein